MSESEVIKLDVTTLLTQSASMKSLKEEYNSLFTNVTSILNEMNDGWSENLANNFIGKISTAQKGFAKIVDMLEVGENVAKEAANSFEEVNAVMARQMSGSFAGLFENISLGTLSTLIGTGINVDMLKEAGITQLPRTSDELALTCAVLADKGYTPMLHHKAGAYYLAFDEIWIEQAMGEEAFMDLYQNPTLEKFKTKDGRYEVLKAMEKIITPEYILAGSNTEEHTIMQTKFLAGEAAMTLNGSWLQNEMGGSGNINFLMMKTPVISAIKNRLETVKSDKDLREVISAVDAVTDGEKTEADYKDGDNYKVGKLNVSASDWAEIKKARNSYVTADTSNACFIPKYSANKEGAKEFLKFLYSDEGMRIYSDATHLTLPLTLDSGDYDTSSWTEYEKNQYQLKDDAEMYTSSDRLQYGVHELFEAGGGYILGIAYPVNYCTKSESQRKTAEDYWNKYIEEIGSKYASWEENIK